jgi:hypothetical protein
MVHVIDTITFQDWTGAHTYTIDLRKQDKPSGYHEYMCSIWRDGKRWEKTGPNLGPLEALREALMIIENDSE